MEPAISSGMCRCCASEGSFKDLKTAYQWMGDEEVYSEMLRECFDISLFTNIEGEVEGGICEVCITHLRSAANFKKQVLDTEEQLKLRIHEGKLYKNDIVKQEVGADDENDSDNDHNISEDFSGTEYDVPIKMETEEPKPKKRAAKASTSRAKRTKTDDGETSKRVTFKLIEGKGIIKVEMTKQSEVEAAKKEPQEKPRSDSELYRLREAARDILTFTNATAIRVHSDLGYACYFCSDHYPDPAELKQHNNQKHTADIKYFFKKSALRGFLVKMDITSLKCNLCSLDFSTVESIVDHLNEEHKKSIYLGITKMIFPFKFDSDKLRCSICPKFFDNFHCLQNHMHSHFGNATCVKCGSGFVNKGALEKHMSSHTSGTYKCSICTKVFPSENKKKVHESRSHTKTTFAAVCQICKEKFHDARKKEKHMVDAHGFAPVDYKCQACGNSYVSKNALLAHTKRYHLLLRPHKCNQCDLAFFSSTELRKHTVSHTGQRKYICDICMKSFGLRNTLTQHIRTHMNDRPYKCEPCGKAFVHRFNWRAHMRSKHDAAL